MNLFPINQPTLALSISEDTLRIVEVKKFWRTTTLQHVNSVALPSDLIRLSSAKPNIDNMDTFIEQLRDRKSTRLNSSHTDISRMPSSA